MRLTAKVYRAGGGMKTVSLGAEGWLLVVGFWLLVKTENQQPKTNN
jgi:hypothetical protein